MSSSPTRLNSGTPASNPSLRRLKSKISVGGEELSVGERIGQIGFGRYQLQIFFFCAGTLWCEGSQVATVSGAKTIVFSKFGVHGDFGHSLLIFILFSGLALGTIASGTIGDTKGRRLPMLIGYLGIILSQAFVQLAPILWILYASVFILGFFSGIGIPAAFTLLSEVVPSDYRGICGAALCIGFNAGEFWSAIGLRIFAPSLVSGSAHAALMFAAIPAVLMLILGLILPAARCDSPEFLAANNRQAELTEALNVMAITNGRPELALKSDLPSGVEIDDPVTFSEAMATLCRGYMGLHTIVLSVMFFTYNFGYYGTVDFWPIGWSSLHLTSIYGATELICTASIGLLGVPVAMLTMSKCNRRPGASCTSVLCAVASVCLLGLLHNNLILGWIGVLVFKLFWMTFQMTTMHLPNEIYPTRISVWAWSIVCFFGRIGCAIVPFSIAYDDQAFLWILSALLLLSASLVWLLPETKDIDLEELDVGGQVKRLDAPENYGSFKPLHSVKTV